MDEDSIADELNSIRSELYGLRFFTVGLYANLLSADPTPLETARRLGKQETTEFERLYELGPVSDAMHFTIQETLQHLEELWEAVVKQMEMREQAQRLKRP